MGYTALMPRTFLAMDLDDSTRRRLARLAESLHLPGSTRLVRPGNLHITAVFLGEISDAQLATACAITGEVLTGHAPLQLQLTGLQARPARGAVRMVWAALDDPADRAGLLVGQLSQRLAEAGLGGDDRPWTPHVTLARIRRITRPGSSRLRRRVEQVSAGLDGGVDVETLSVYTSELTRNGPIYTPAVRVALSG
jgi:2'-5' RNA ligase